jgi:type IV fimbrial biogenesis protein FimT
MRQRGFSLVELMVTIAVLAVMIAIAYPSFSGTLRSNRLAGSTNELVASLSLARSEGVRSARGSGICASVDGLACAGDWSDGWIVWVEGQDSATPEYDSATDEIVRHVGGRGRIQVDAASTEGDVPSVAFDARGRPAVADLPVAWRVEPDDCPSGQMYVRTISMTLAGQIKNIQEPCP